MGSDRRPAAKRAAAAAPANAAGDAARVLIVDDDAGVRESTAEILRSRGFEVEEASDGLRATWILASEKVDVVLLDLHLFTVDGTEVLDVLEASSTVVIFSAFEYFDEDLIKSEFEALIFDSLRKPVPPEHLIDVVTAAAIDAREKRNCATVRPIDTLGAIRLALVRLAGLRPGDERSESQPVPTSGRRLRKPTGEAAG